MTHRIVFELAYDGAAYCGFARQENGTTVAGVLEEALRAIDPDVSPVTAASRTDAGVHARAQVVSFTTEKSIASRGWVLALAQRLPADIVVTAAAEADPDFDPRIDPLAKRYCYRVLHSQVDDPFLAGRAWRVHQPLDRELLSREAADLVGEHDFSAFRSAKDPRPDAVRTLFEVTAKNACDDERVLELRVRGNRFLYNMVRIIVGTLVDVGRGRLPPGAVKRALSSGRRSDLGMTAPAAGLTLECVELRSRLHDRWPPAGVPLGTPVHS